MGIPTIRIVMLDNCDAKIHSLMLMNDLSIYIYWM